MFESFQKISFLVKWDKKNKIDVVVYVMINIKVCSVSVKKMISVA